MRDEKLVKKLRAAYDLAVDLFRLHHFHCRPCRESCSGAVCKRGVELRQKKFDALDAWWDADHA